MKGNDPFATRQPDPAVVAESAGWQSAHYEEPYYARRTAKLPEKLRRLGILDAPRDARVLDACCGRGEALHILRGHGFRNLEGIDATPQAGVSAEIPLRHGDVTRMPFADQSFDLVMNLHALHHMGGADGVSRFLAECRRILKPGGALAILDFPGSPQIRLLFWALRKRLMTLTGELRNFAEILDEEWSYLAPYLDAWPQVKLALERGPLTTVRNDQRFFLYYRTMRREAGA